MNWSFGNAHLLPLAILAGLPFLIHLIARLRPRRCEFSSIEFILRGVRKTRKWQRPKDWLVLLLRTAAVAALLLAFLQPRTFESQAWSEEEDSGRTVALVVDATASMAYDEGGGSRFNRALAEASGVLSSLRSGDRANIVWVRERPVSSAAQPSRNLDFLRESLQRARVTYENGSGAAAVETALDLLGQVEGPRELILISDFQQNTWEAPLPPIPDSVRLAALPVAANPSPANTAVRRLWLEPERPLAGETVAVTAEIVNHSDQPRRLDVLFSSGPFRQSEDVFLEGWESRLVTTVLHWDEPGEYAVRASIPEDGFPPDNFRDAVVEVTGGARIVLAGDPGPPHPSWTSAFRALEGVRVDERNTGQPGFGEADVVVWTGDDPRRLDTFAALLERGGTVLWHPAPGAQHNGEALARQQLREPQALRLIRPDDPLFAVFSGGDYGDPARGAYQERLRWPSDNGAAPAAVLLAWQDDAPALLRKSSGNGRIYGWNIPLEENGRAAYALHPEFLAIAGEIARTARDGIAVPGRQALPGRSVTRPFPADWGVRETVLEGPRDHRQQPAWEGDAHFDRFFTAPLPEPGVYSWKSEGRTVGLTAVHFPADQSDLRTRNPDTFVADAAITLTHARQVRQLREGVDWWPLFLALAVAFLTAEALFCRLARPDSGGTAS